MVSKSETNAGALVKSGPVGDMGTNAIETAIRMPPHAIRGITWETPVSKYCLCFCNISFVAEGMVVKGILLDTFFAEFGQIIERSTKIQQMLCLADWGGRSHLLRGARRHACARA